MNRCDDAIQKRSESQAAILALRLTQIEPLFAKVNGERRRLEGKHASRRWAAMGGSRWFVCRRSCWRVRIDTLESVRADIGEV